MSVEIILLSIVIVLLVTLIILQIRKSGEISILQKSVATKKLKVAEKYLDNQLGAPSLGGMMEQLQQAASNKEDGDSSVTESSFGFRRTRK